LANAGVTVSAIRIAICDKPAVFVAGCKKLPPKNGLRPARILLPTDPDSTARRTAAAAPPPTVLNSPRPAALCFARAKG
jgi:hypothetical protein